jgi:hypothetical protein
VAPLPARQPRLPPPSPGRAAGAGRPLIARGTEWSGRTWLPLLGLAALGALALAADAHVKGPAAVDEVARAAFGAVLLFGACGYALARLLLPESLAPWRALFVLPLGAAASGIALTALGFAAVPYKVALVATLALGALGAQYAVRRRADLPAAIDPRQLACLAAACALIFAVAMIPTFRSGFATVTGTGADAHQVAGAATFVQHNYPSSTDVAYPVDEVRAIWNSKYPIFYALAGASSLAGLEPWETMMAVAALLLALTAAGLFLLARRLFAAGAGVAAIAMGIAVLDQQVFHVAVHPYYNQMWGLFTLPFSIVLGHAWVEDRSRGAFALFALMTALGAFAYPLMLPFPLLVVGGFWLLDRRARRARGERVESLHPRRLWRGARSLVWMVPAAVLLLLPIRGVVQKVRDAIELALDPEQSLEDWGGDLFGYPPFPEFLALPDVPVAGWVGAAAVLALAGWLLWRAPRRFGVPILATLAAALAAAGWFALVEDGQYFYFKTLSFAGALIVTAAVVALSRLAWRPAAVAGIALLAVTAPLGAREELAGAFDQLPRQTVELREWSERLPEGASVRLDTGAQIWHSYMLSDRPVSSSRPITAFPYPPYSLGADYALTDAGEPRPLDAAGEAPVFENDSLRLWKVKEVFRGERRPDLASRRLERFVFDESVE